MSIQSAPDVQSKFELYTVNLEQGYAIKFCIKEECASVSSGRLKQAYGGILLIASAQVFR